MKVKFFDAKNGDAIHLVTNTNKNILIDMGYPETYSNSIKKHLMELGGDEQKVDLLVVSHIDRDHVGGALSFLQDICQSEFDKTTINEIWHNSYRHLNLSQVERIGAEDLGVLRTFKESIETENRRAVTSVGDKEISAKQGSTLAGLIYKLGIPWNETFDRGPITGIKRISLSGSIITVLTPKPPVLEKLKRFWRTELLKLKYDFKFGEDELFDDAYEFYLLNEAVLESDAAVNISGDTNEKFQDLLESGVNKVVVGDSSITNASSISLIIEEAGKRILLTGDATDDDLFDALTSLFDEGVSMDFDLIKLSHHGALKNNMKWLSMVTARYYVISTDSSNHNHPDIGAIVNVILNNKGQHKTICFNHYLKSIEEMNNSALMEIYNYSILTPNQDWGIEIEL